MLKLPEESPLRHEYGYQENTGGKFAETAKDLFYQVSTAVYALNHAENLT